MSGPEVDVMQMQKIETKRPLFEATYGCLRYV